MESTTWFYRLATTASVAAGSAWMFLASLVACGVWLVLGPFLHWGELWNLIPTSILTWTTWVLVVLVQHEQIVTTKALQTKIDAIIFGLEQVNNAFVGLETKGEQAINTLHKSVQTAAQFQPPRTSSDAPPAPKETGGGV